MTIPLRMALGLSLIDAATRVTGLLMISPFHTADLRRGHVIPQTRQILRFDRMISSCCGYKSWNPAGI
jgi:hypothetical protein